MTNHSDTPEVGITKPLYRLKDSDGRTHYVVADGFDDAVRKLHHHMWAARQWPKEALTPEHADRGEGTYTSRIIEVSLFANIWP